MDLSSELVSQFVKLTNDDKETSKETTVYGTTVELNGRTYVRIDGSDRLTPVSTTTDVQADERVTVMIKDHTATVTGNLSSPAARTDDVQDIGNKISEFEIVIADKVSTKQLDAEIARIDALTADNVTIKDTLNATNANIKNLQADNVTINEKLVAADAEIDELSANKLDVDVAVAEYATIKNLEATNAEVYNLQATYGEFVELTAKNFEAANASIDKLEADNVTINQKLTATEAEIDALSVSYGEFETLTAGRLDAAEAGIKDLTADNVEINTKLTAAEADIDKLSANKLDATFANIDFANLDKATIGELYVASGIMKDVVVGDGTFVGELIGVTIKGDLIEAGTLKVDRLVIRGTDGEYYKLNTDFTALSGVEPVAEDAIHGSTLIANSVTAEKIRVEDLVAFDATIAGFHITNEDGKPGSIYSGEKASVDADNIRGIYLDNEGQFAFGDDNNYMKFYKDTDGTYKFLISADQIVLGTDKKNIDEIFEETRTSAQQSVDAAEGRILATVGNTYAPKNEVVLYPTIINNRSQSVTVDNALANSIENIRLFGKTTQITGIGKNLLNLDAMLNECLVKNDDGSYTMTKTSSSQYSGYQETDIPAGTYYFSSSEDCECDIDGTGYLYLYTVYSNGSTQTNRLIQDGYNTQKLTFTDTVVKMRIFIYPGENVGAYITFRDAQLEAGDTRTAYEPYTVYPSPDGPSSLVSAGVGVGKNILDVQYAPYIHNVVSTNKSHECVITKTGIHMTKINATSTNDWHRCGFIIGKASELAGKTLTLSCNRVYSRTDSNAKGAIQFVTTSVNGGYVGTSAISTLKESRNDTITYTVSGEEKYLYIGIMLYFSYGGTSEIGDTCEYSNIQVEIGDAATEYEPYRKNVVETTVNDTIFYIPTSYGLPGLLVESDGNYTDSDGQQWICDEIDLARGVYIQRTVSVVFDQNSSGISLTSNVAQSPSTNCRFDLVDRSITNILKQNTTSRQIVLSNYTTASEGANKTGVWLNNTNDYFEGRLSVDSSIASSVDELKALLAITPIEFLVPLAEPVETRLTDDEIEQFTSLTNLPGTINITSDANAEIQLSSFATGKHVESTVQQLSDRMTLSFIETNETVNQINDRLQEQLNTVTKHFTFDVDGMTIGATDNPNKVVIDNDEVGIYVNDEVVQQFVSSGDALIPLLNVTRSFNLLGYTIQRSSGDTIDCDWTGIKLMIVKQPKNQTANVGETATVEVQAIGEGVTFECQASYDEGATWEVIETLGLFTTSFSSGAIYSLSSETENIIRVKFIVTDEDGNNLSSNIATIQWASKSEEGE